MKDIIFDLHDEHIGILTFNRPQAMNAFSLNLLAEVNQLLDELEKNTDLRALIITGDGHRAFSAGADLKERRGMDDTETIQAVKLIGNTINRVSNLEIPVIAAINGVAFGGGLELALACDLRVAAEDIKMGLTETSLAIIPGAGGTQRLARLIGVGQAKKLIYTAKRIDTKEAHEIGIVEDVFTADKLLEEAINIANQISNNGPLAIKLAKKAIDAGLNDTLENGLEIEHKCYKKTLGSYDRVEGLNAFKEKRKPSYTGK